MSAWSTSKLPTPDVRRRKIGGAGGATLKTRRTRRSNGFKPGPQPDSRTLPGVLGLLIGLGFLAYWAIYRNTLTRVRTGMFGDLFQWPVDFRVYYNAASYLNSGGDLYKKGFLGDLPFTYPPFAGFVMKALPLGSMHSVAVLWQVGSLACLGAVIVGVLRERGYRFSFGFGAVSIAALFASFNLAAVQGTFFYGQINIYLMALVALDFLRRQSRFGRGIGTGLAAGIKLTPAFFLLVFVVQRSWWALLTCLLTIAVTVVVGIIAIPDGSDFWTEAIFKTNRIGVQDNPGAESLQGVLHRVHVPNEQFVWILTVIAACLVCAVAVRGALRRGNWSMAMSVAGMTAPMVSPFSWFHHWVFVVPMCLVLIEAIIGSVAAATKKIPWRPVGWFIEQIVALAAVAVVALIFLPQVSHTTLFEQSYFGQYGQSSWWLKGLFVFSSFLLLVVIAVFYLLADAASLIRSRHLARAERSGKPDEHAVRSGAEESVDSVPTDSGASVAAGAGVGVGAAGITAGSGGVSGRATSSDARDVARQSATPIQKAKPKPKSKSDRREIVSLPARHYRPAQLRSVAAPRTSRADQAGNSVGLGHTARSGYSSRIGNAVRSTQVAHEIRSSHVAHGVRSSRGAIQGDPAESATVSRTTRLTTPEASSARRVASRHSGTGGAKSSLEMSNSRGSRARARKSNARATLNSGAKKRSTRK